MKRTLLVAFAMAAACAHTPPAPVPPVDVLYRQAEQKSHPGHFLWWEINHCDDAIPLYQRVVDTYPFSQYAVEAQLGIADCYFSQEQWSDAIFHYRDFEKLHPSHQAIGRVRYQLGEAYHAQSLPYDLDTSDLQQAYFYYGKAAYAEGPFAKEAATKNRAEADRLAERVYYIGRFYERNDEALSAIDRYAALIAEFPASPLAAEARRRAANLYRAIGTPEKIESLALPAAPADPVP